MIEILDEIVKDQSPDKKSSIELKQDLDIDSFKNAIKLSVVVIRLLIGSYTVTDIDVSRTSKGIPFEKFKEDQFISTTIEKLRTVAGMLQSPLMDQFGQGVGEVIERSLKSGLIPIFSLREIK